MMQTQKRNSSSFNNAYSFFLVMVVGTVVWPSWCEAQEPVTQAPSSVLTDSEVEVCHAYAAQYVIDVKQRILLKNASKYSTDEGLAKLDSAMVKMRESAIYTCQTDLIQKKEIAKKDLEIARKTEKIVELDRINAKRMQEIAAQEKEIEELDKSIALIREIKADAKELSRLMREVTKKAETIGSKNSSSQSIMTFADEIRDVIERGNRYIAKASPILVDDENQEVFKNMARNFKMMNELRTEFIGLARVQKKYGK